MSEQTCGGGKQKCERTNPAARSTALEKNENNNKKQHTNVLMLDMAPGHSSLQRGSGRSFHVEGPKTEKAREPTVESLVRGIVIGLLYLLH